MRYWEVTCKHGHHGNRQYIPITFAIIADTAVEACDTARAMPGVKHDQSVMRMREISATEYNILRSESAYKRSLKCDYRKKEL